MERHNLKIGNIPAIIWGKDSSKMFVAIHGNMSHKEDDVISILAEEAIDLGFQVLSFDLPKHGDRKEEPTPCKVQNCVEDLKKVMKFARLQAEEISLFACSLGAYFSLLAYRENKLKKALFLSPIVNMQRVIDNMMMWFNVSQERLKEEQEIQTPIGETLYWDYYCYVNENPILCWNKDTEILYGQKDDLCEYDVISSFAKQFRCDIEVLDGGEHYFHTSKQLEFFRKWLKTHL